MWRRRQVIRGQCRRGRDSMAQTQRVNPFRIFAIIPRKLVWCPVYKVLTKLSFIITSHIDPDSLGGQHQLDEEHPQAIIKPWDCRQPDQGRWPPPPGQCPRPSPRASAPSPASGQVPQHQAQTYCVPHCQGGFIEDHFACCIFR